MGLLGSIVTVRFGELCSLSDPAEPLALRALKCSHTFVNEIVASHVPECTRSCFCDLVFVFHLHRSKPSDISYSGSWRCRTCQPILEFIFLESKQQQIFSYTHDLHLSAKGKKGELVLCIGEWTLCSKVKADERELAGTGFKLDWEKSCLSKRREFQL